MERVAPTESGYQPGKLFDAMLHSLGARSDAELARLLHISPTAISKIRHGRMAVSSTLLINMHEVSRLEIRDLKALMGERRRQFRLSPAEGRPSARLAA
jgi:transcriptional regulator with XRE-family HTH domain